MNPDWITPKEQIRLIKDGILSDIQSIHRLAIDQAKTRKEESKKECYTVQTFFISDLHLGHANCLRFDNRPWQKIEDMDTEIIRRWNAKVSTEDHVYVLGDFAFRNSMPVSEYVKQLNGFIHLIRGNHDKKDAQSERCFREVADYKELKIQVCGVPVRVVLSHYCIPFYNGAHNMAFMLHGHTHKSGESDLEEAFKAELRAKGIRCEAYNVGAMWQNYEPQTFEEIIARQGRKIDII